MDCWYLGWTEPLLEAAEEIVWLDLPWRVAARRIVLRHVRAGMARNNQHPGLRRLFDFLRAERQRYISQSSATADLLARDSANNRATTARILAVHRAKLVHCRGSGDVAAYLTRYRL